ncbi:SAM-dependent methyltransferase [Streptomyces sp. NPDC102274]|uniref:SAM-dependent methyltransferase n=1 Tax=Streptomyces sp. NPDC102274 TaxID=3366151 RepID=UPI00381D0016
MHATRPAGLRSDFFTRPTPARVYDRLLGGKDHYPADTAVVERLLDAAPFLPGAMAKDRVFVDETVQELAAVCGLRQVIDLGCGLPRPPYLHDVIAEHRPDGRVLYVDDDPVVAAHSTAVMSSRTSVVTGHLRGDITRPRSVLASPQLAETIDLSEPVILVWRSVLHHLTDEEMARSLREFSQAVCPGSALVATHFTADFRPGPMRSAAEILTGAGVRTSVRSGGEITAALVRYWELVPPGLATPDFASDTGQWPSYAAVGRKP